LSAPMERSLRCHVATFGCRVNQADSEGILSQLESAGMEPSASHLDSDLVVINSCTVTHRSDADVRKLVHRIQRENPRAKVIVTGCYAQRDPEAIASLGGAAAIVGHSHSDQIGSIALRVLSSNEETIVVRTSMDEIEPSDLPPVDPVAVVHDRTRPFVKIQDGCDALCTYCVIPSVRGPARSAPGELIEAAVRKLVAQGYFEVVIAGIHLGTYGRSTGDDLASLVRRLLQIQGLGRLRLSAIEPMAFPIELADLAAVEPRLAPHFHLPLQSGSDRILKRMNRPYRAERFVEILEAIKARVPNACLGTDVIVGFPGETEADFEDTLAIVARSGLDYVHAFSYSDRPGVPSTKLPGKVDPRIIKERIGRLIERSHGLWARFLDRQIGRTLEALTLERDPSSPEVIESLSAEYCPIRSMNASLVANRPVSMRVLRREGSVLWGEPAA
jgi:threonylcarbamoyladenosine tRNA methylthiotransferase MtaB